MATDDPPTSVDAEHRILIFDIEPAWGCNTWLHGRVLDTGQRVMYFLTNHRPHMFCEPGAEAVEHPSVVDVEEGHVSVDGDELVKLTLSHPGRTNKVRELCENPHEADTPYILRTAVDTEAWGICHVKGERVRAGVYKTKPEWIEQETREVSEDLDTIHVDIEGGNVVKIESAPDPVVCIGVLDPRYGDWVLFSYHQTRDLTIETAQTMEHGEVEVDHHHFVDARDSDGEKRMLEAFIDWLYQRKPEAVATFNGNHFDWPYLINRAQKLGISSKRWGGHGKLDAKYVNLPGIQSLDLYKVHETATYGGLAGGNTLEDVLEEFTGIEKESHGEKVFDWWDENPRGLFEYNLQDVEATYLIDEAQRYGLTASSLMFLTYTLDLTSITKVSDLYYGLFLEEAGKRGEALPLRFGGDEFEMGGGLVFEPEVGLHEKACSADVSSLYPTVIVTGNISYETLVPDSEATGDEEWVFEVPDVENDKLVDPPLYFDTRKKGILPTVIEKVWTLKREAGKEMRSADGREEKELLEITYDSRKIALNGGFGIASSDKSPLGRAEVGAAITSAARHVNRTIADTIEKTGREVVYGDTDSSKFVPAEGDDMDDIYALMEECEDVVRSDMADRGAIEPDRYELEWEHVYEPLLLTPKKKRYAMRLIWDEGEMLDPPERKVSGFWMVRRDCSDFTKEVQGRAFDILLMERKGPMAMHEYIRSVYNDILEGRIKKERIAARKPLTGDIFTYTKREDGETTWTYWVAESCHAANKFFGFGEQDKWRAGDRPHSYKLKDAPDEYEGNYLPLRAGKPIPDGFTVDWTHHADLMVGNKLKRVYQALGIEDLLDQLGRGGLQDAGVEFDVPDEPATAPKQQSSMSRKTRQRSVTDFM